MVQITISLNEKQAFLLERATKRRRLKNMSTFVKKVVEKELQNDSKKAELDHEEVIIEEVLTGDPDWDIAQKLLKTNPEWIKFSNLVDNISEVTTCKFTGKRQPSIREQLDNL